MKFSQVFTAATMAAGVFAAPAEIQARQQTVSEVDILNFALTLEHLEAAFYQQAVTNYTRQQFIAAGFADPYYENVIRLRNQEREHVNFLTSALRTAGATPVQACTYAFPVNSVASYAAVSQILEGVGVSAYNGAAQFLSTADYITAAASILGVEARHAAYIRDKNRKSPFAAVFEIPITGNSAFTLASAFIVRCPQNNPTIPFYAYPTLALAANQPQPIRVGDVVTLNIRSATNKQARYACWPLLAGAVCNLATRKSATQFTAVVPRGGVTGQGYVFLTTVPELVAANVVAGPAVVETLPPPVV